MLGTVKYLGHLMNKTSKNLYGAYNVVGSGDNRGDK